MGRALRLIALLGLAAACDGAESAARAEPFFEREGLPGPWWRPGATASEFEDEHRACLASAQRARRGAGDAADAAYRQFLSCMERGGWLRGLPPAPIGRDA